MARPIPAVLMALSALVALPCAAEIAPVAHAGSGTDEPVAPPASAPSPGEIVAAAPDADWVPIAPEDLLVMTLAPDAAGRPRQVVIQLMPPPFSEGWVGNIRKLAAARWYDGIAIVRVQDNYVVQWGDPDGEDPAKAKPLPAGLALVSERQYSFAVVWRRAEYEPVESFETEPRISRVNEIDQYAGFTGFALGWPVAGTEHGRAKGAGLYGRPLILTGDKPLTNMQNRPVEAWPVHCYGMVGVGRNLSPDTGTGAELYTVIGHAPRHLDRNIALVGRVIDGIEHLSSLPRGTGALGFYERAGERMPIVSVRIADTLPEAERPRFAYLGTESESFARYADARANRRDAFFNVPAGGADICNIPVPIRKISQ